jgi:hypothetical protein
VIVVLARVVINAISSASTAAAMVSQLRQLQAVPSRWL